MNMTGRRYIAYGSNLNRAQMALRCPDAKVVGTGEIKDYELLKSHLDKSYEKNVPAQVRKFVESRMETPQETANQEEESQRTGGTRQQRASGRRSRETQNQEEQPREPVPETVEETAENTMSMGM